MRKFLVVCGYVFILAVCGVVTVEATTLHQRVLITFAKATGGQIVKCIKGEGVTPYPKEPPVCVSLSKKFYANKLLGPATGSKAMSDFDAYKNILVKISSMVFEPTSDLTVTFRGAYKVFWKPNNARDCKEYTAIFFPDSQLLIAYLMDREYQNC